MLIESLTLFIFRDGFFLSLVTTLELFLGVLELTLARPSVSIYGIDRFVILNLLIAANTYVYGLQIGYQKAVGFFLSVV